MSFISTIYKNSPKMIRMAGLLVNKQLPTQFIRNAAFANGTLNKSKLLVKHSVSKQPCRNSGEGGIPGENFPFKLGSKWFATITYTIFFAVAWWAPYLVVVLHMLYKA